MRAHGTRSASPNTSSFEDATGENPDGVEITSVRVSNDDEGLLTFRINIPTRATFTEDMRLRVWFDSDSNPKTGLTSTDVAGRDYFGAESLKPRSQRLAGSRATCVFAIAPKAKGRTLRGSITIAFDGKTVTKSFSRQIG